VERDSLERMGEGGFCVCMHCGTKILHRENISCRAQRCPKCGTAMLREGSRHHLLALENKGHPG
jgi:Zn-finger nucleic acid-binding protein